MNLDLKTATWINPERIRRVSIIFLAIGILATITLIATSSGNLDVFGRPLGTDFSNVYTAGQMVWDGRDAVAYVPVEQEKVQQALFNDPDVPFYAWHYPPFFLILAAGLALLPYTVAWLTWMAATLPLYAVAMRRILDDKTALIASLGFPAVAVNFLHGQNGFLTAALIGGAILCLRSKPLMAGVLIAMLAYKPQFGVLIPIALLAGGYYRTFAVAAVTLLAMCALATLAFGTDIWLGFYESRHFSQNFILEAGSTGWHKIQSVFSATRMWGGSIGQAYFVQSCLGLFLVVSTAWIWRSRVSYDLKAASLIVGSLLLTPYMLDYDMVALAPALLFVTRYGLRAGFLPYERVLLAIVWMAPILTRPAIEYLALPIGLAAMLGLYGLVLYKARGELRAPQSIAPMAA
nr:glycosyltransferase family 87 protein [Hyphomonas sp. Mor2]